MKCNYLLDNKKCSLVSHMKGKKGFAIGENNICIYDNESDNCRYYENEHNDYEGGSYDDYEKDEYENGFGFEKLMKKKHLEN